MLENLHIIYWPDPRLKKPSQAVEQFDDRLRALAGRMVELMHEARGVGLAAPQVAQGIRLFTANPDGQPGNDRVYVNPVLLDLEGDDEAEEGCLSLPQLSINVLRARRGRIQAYDLDGKPFEETSDGFLARVWQHEFDHLDGVLLTDRMGAVAKLANRRLLKDLEEKYAAQQAPAAKRVKLPL
jgi:peptide deformylase